MSLFNLAFARQQGGRFVLRIEDTDRARFREDSEQQVFDTLHWLGPQLGRGAGRRRAVRALPPERAARHLPPVRRAAPRRRAGPTTAGAPPSGWREMREKQQKAKQPTGYDRLCLGKTARGARAQLPGFSETPVVRMLIPDDAPLTFDDLIRGRGLGAAPRRPGHPQGRRLPDLPPRRRRRRPRDGHHPRRARRGVDLQHPQAHPALPVARPGAADVRPHAAAAQHRQVQDLQAQEPRRPADVVPGAGLPARGAASTSSRCLPTRRSRGRRGRGRRGLHVRGVPRATSTGEGQPGRPDLRPQEARLAQRRLHPRRSTSATSPRGSCRSSRPTECSATTRASGELGPAREGHRAHPDPHGAAHRGERPRAAVLRRATTRSRSPTTPAPSSRTTPARCSTPRSRPSRTSTTAAPGVLGSGAAGRPRRSRRPCARRSSRGWASSPSSRSGRCARRCRAAGVSPPLFESMEILGKGSTLDPAAAHCARRCELHASARRRRPQPPRRPIWERDAGR